MSKLADKLLDYLTTTDAHKIGLMYLILSIINFVLAGVAAMYMRYTIAATPPATAVSDPFNDQLYTWFMSLHGLAMLLLFATQALVGLANVLVPKLIGAPDLYWPRINALSFWMQIPFTVFLWSSLFFWQDGDSIGWTLYPPLSTRSPSLGVDLILIGIVIGGLSTTLTGINFILTITRLRRPDIKMLDMSLFAWSVLASSMLMVMALPPLSVGAVMLLLERHLGLPFFDVTPGNPAASGDPRLFQHIFWFFGHPEVYILVLPAMGLVSEVIQRMARRRAYGYTAIAVSSVAIAAISFAVWMHHMFTAVQDYAPRIAMALTTMAVAIPSGVKVFNWVATLYGGRISLRAPMLFMLTFLLFFIVGGVTGVFFPVVTLDLHLQDTYFVLGHFHYIVNAIAFGALGALLYYFPHLTGRWYNERLAVLSWGLITVGGFMAYTLMSAAGILGSPRRYAAVPTPDVYPYHVGMTIFTIILAAGLVIYFANLLYSLFNGRPVENRADPWGSSKYGLPDVIPPVVKPHHEPNPWPFILGVGMIPLGLGALSLLKEVSPKLANYSFLSGPHIGLAAVGTFIALGVAWFVLDQVKTARMLRLMNGAAHFEIPKPPSLWGDLKVSISWVILSEIAFFGSFISSVYYARVVLYEGWNAALHHVPELITPLSLAMSFALWSSSFTAMMARRSLLKGRRGGFFGWLAATMALGIFFAAAQFFAEYPELFAHGFTPGSSIIASYFFTIVTLHGFHVIIGLVFWGLVGVLVALGYWNEKRPDGVEAAEYYWHFVDAVWVVLFLTFYLGAVNMIAPAPTAI
ncbi:Heme/copper-type cytochrome/quinol oxidase, subunit 1 SoxM-type [Pyrobaculum oguniense TE7]|uniref:Heme/copper-type cytochrome/quinol oxidase, subunit 1 SoxM-type n=2 Tax=Pyrobaculum oguniense TaxID=99007 RepID=H6Q9C9_PYROT|nr:Heme/copper-type cytochrome/quinol oxidase, subunit 1 SoxM-type [Pyrobaculum oguniense TE7]BAC56132.1 cytochrome c oxidase subunit I+III [Pyrobaculum oguniense TE7]